MDRLLLCVEWAGMVVYSYGLGASVHYLELGGSEWWTALVLMVQGIGLFWFGRLVGRKLL